MKIYGQIANVAKNSFWSMMDEINEEEDFVVEGPLWIQVHAFEKGVEVTISKSKNEDMMNMSDDDATDQFDEQVQELLAQTLEGEDQLEELFEARRTKEKEAQGSKRQKSSARKNTRTIIVKFNDLEDVINYAYHSNPITTEFEDLLYMVDGTYYYAVHFDSHVDQEVINDSYSQLLEFAYPTDRTEVYLNDYAKIIMSHNVHLKFDVIFQHKNPITILIKQRTMKGDSLESLFLLISKAEKVIVVKLTCNILR